MSGLLQGMHGGDGRRLGFGWLSDRAGGDGRADWSVEGSDMPT